MKLILFPFHDWRKAQAEGARTRDAHLIEAFLADPRIESILIVDRPSSPLEPLFGRARRVGGPRVATARIGSSRGTLTRIDDRGTVLDIETSAIVGPLLRRRGWWFDVFTEPDVLGSIDWAVRETKSNGATIVAWVPTVAPAVLRLLSTSVATFIYDSLDNWLIHPELSRNAAKAADAYRSLLPRARRVFASAPASQAVLYRFTDAVDILPNGVDPERFAGTFARPTDLPTDQLIVGYAGKLAERIDIGIVQETAALMPDASFVFIGPALDRRAIRPLRRLPNVTLLGDKRYPDLPAYLAHFDVAWIPHRVGAGETGGDPIKLYEYWAAGRPIFSTPIDGVDVWRPRVQIVRSAADVMEAIEQLGTPPYQADHSVPQERTWRSIAQMLLGT